MKTTYALSLAVAALSLFSVTSCKTPQRTTRVTRTVTVVYSSPSSVAGKRIALDFSSAQTRTTTGVPGENAAWSPCNTTVITTKPFKKNNQCLNVSSSSETCYWTYKKTGSNTAELTNGIGCESDLGFPATYYLTFDTATSGTARAYEGGEGADTETVGIRFSLK